MISCAPVDNRRRTDCLRASTWRVSNPPQVCQPAPQNSPPCIAASRPPASFCYVIRRSFLTMNVCIIGTGYVGLTTGVCLAFVGHKVACLDSDERKIATLRAGQTPIYEPYLT